MEGAQLGIPILNDRYFTRSIRQILVHSYSDTRSYYTLHGTVNLTRYERHLPLIPLSDLDIKDVIRLLRGVAETTDNNATYNFENTFENNLFKITGDFVPDNMEEAQTMQFLIMKLLKACPSSVTKDIHYVVTGVCR